MTSAMRAPVFAVGVMVALGVMPTPANAQDYPNHSITVVVPFPAGGPSDVVARIVADQMGRVLGQTLVIENVGGAGGTLGSGRVAAAAPDGYTLLAGSMGSHVAAPVLTPNIKYDSARDFMPIGPTAHSPAVIVARKDFPAKDLKEFVALLKSSGATLEAGPRRHRLVVAHGVPAVHLGDRRQAHARRLSRHRAGDERPDRRPCRFLLRAVGQRHRAGRSPARSRPMRCRPRQRLASLPDVPTAKEFGINYDEHLGRHLRAEGHAARDRGEARRRARQGARRRRRASSASTTSAARSRRSASAPRRRSTPT